MAHPDSDDFAPNDGLYASRAAGKTHRSRRRKQAVGLAGLAVVVGGAVLLATGPMSGGHTTIHDTGALAPVVPATSPTPSPTKPATTGPSPTKPKVSATASKRVSPSPTPSDSLSARQTADAARPATSKDGAEVQRPITPKGQIDSAVTETTVMSPEDGGSIKVSSARTDLTGYAEMSWAGDKGQAVGKVRCTRKFRFAQGVPATTKPTMLLCWHTSATRSVYTLAVSPHGKPKAAASVAAINAQWAKLG